MKYYLLIIALVTLTFCKAQTCNVELKIDKFTGDTTYRSQVYTTFGLPGQFAVQKVISQKYGTTYFLFVTMLSASYHILPKGLTLLFEDGTKLQYDNAEGSFINYSDGYNSYLAMAVISLDDLKKISEKKITDMRLYVIDNVHLKAQQKKLLEAAKCLLDYKTN